MKAPFIISTLAGITTLIGYFAIFIFKKENKKVIPSALSFASGVMVCVSLTDLIPESFNEISKTFYTTPTIIIIFIFISIGVLLSIFIDKCLPTNENQLYHVGIFSMIAIILHNIPEGIATFIASSSKISLGVSLAIAIALHNVPEGISIAIPIYYSTKNKKKAFFYTLISGLSEPLGAVIAYLFLKPIMTNTIMGIIFSIIAGIMLHISFYELLPTSLSYKNTKLTIIFFILGFIFMLTGHFIFSI